MSHKYFYIDKKGDNVILSREDERHLLRVLRKKKGSEISVSSGDGQDYLCKITSIDPFELIIDREEKPTIQRRDVGMFLSLAKGDKLALMLQKCTELGATRFYLFPTENSEGRAKNQDFKLERFQRIIIEAAKQCARSDIPTIQFASGIDEALELCDKDFYFCHEKADERLTQKKLPERISIFIGPEGGFSEIEVDKAKTAGGTPVLISNNILRCETAAITSLAIAMEL